MKKLIAVLSVFLLLCGCSNFNSVSASEVAKKYSGGFSAKADVVFGENNAKLEIIKNPMSISIDVTSPKEIEGLSLVIFDEHAKVKYNGIEQEISLENLPEGAVFLLVKELFDDLEDEDEFTLSTENGEIKIFSEDFFAVVSSEDLSLMNADFKKYKTRFEFTEFVFENPK